MIRGGAQRLTALFVVIILFSPLGVASGAPQSSGSPFSIALAILPQKLPADGNVYPAVLVSLVDSIGQPTIAFNDTTVLLTSSSDGVGRVQSSVMIASGRAFTAANFTTTSAPGTTTLTATAAGLRTASATVTTVIAVGYPTHLSIIALPDTVPARGAGRLEIELQDDLGLPAKAISDTTVSLFSSNTKVLNVTQSTVLITSGEFVQLADYTTGLVPGSASVTASASGFASGVTTLPGVTVLGLAPLALKLYAQPDKMVQCVLPATSCTGRLVIALTDLTGNPARAQRDITVQIRSANNTVITAPPSVVIKAGNISVVSSYTALATAASSGQAVVAVSSPGLKSDFSTINTYKPVGLPTQLTLFVGPNPLPADHRSYSSVEVSLLNSAGLPTVSQSGDTGVTITSSIVGVGNFSGITLTVPSGSNFQATSFTSTFVVGSTTLTATGQNLQPIQGQLSTFGSLPSKVVLKAITPTLPADGSTHPALVVLLEDSSNTPAITPTSIHVNISSSQRGVVRVASVTIGAGQTFSIVNVDTGTVAGTTSVTALVSTLTTGLTVSTVSLQTVVPAPSSLAAFALTKIVLPTAKEHPVFGVQLQDSLGNPARARVTTNVTVTSSNTTVISKSFTISLKGGQDYVISRLSILAAGATQLTVSSEGLAAAVIPITVIAYPLQATLSASPPTIFTNQTSTVIANVVLAGKGFPGAKIGWLVHSGSLSSPNSTTDRNGQATVTFSPKAPGVGSVTAIISGGAFGIRNYTTAIVVLSTSSTSKSFTTSLTQLLFSFPYNLVLGGGIVAIIVVAILRIRGRHAGEEIATDEAGIE
ncbi:MAG: hypothetical protein E6K90_06270 [Thaumarchaeota archaeon]|nr:MAG: hypothetical protein E6K90_06270 [Nitrososphaerota archaeon]